MRLLRDATFDQERTAFTLQHCCEECGLFDPVAATCAHEWPTADHRRARYEAAGDEVIFCKEFELR